MKYAVFSIGGNQHKVEEGEEILVDKLDGELGKKVEFSDVLLVADGKKVRIGAPYLKGVGVRASLVGQEKGEKIRVFKYKSKSRYRKRMGHRTKYTRVRIEKIPAL